MGYSFAQLEGLWEQAGGSHALAPVMAAIALAESGGNPNVTGKAAGEKGLWQINPKVWGSLATYDPLGNAKAAVHVESTQGLSAWTTYNNGAYKHFLSSAAPSGKLPGGAGGSGGGTGGTGGSSTDPTLQQAATGLTGKTAGGIGEGILHDILSYVELPFTVFGAVERAISATEEGLLAVAAPLVKVAEALDWFFVPSHWIRIMSGVGGTILAAGGIFELARTGDDHPTALPIGIGMTGFGFVLLFVAFHNLDPSIKTVGEALADVQGKAQTSLQATVSPAAAVTAAGG